MSGPEPIALTDEQLDAIIRASAPLARQDRGVFLEAVVKILRAQPELGDGVVHRAIREAQRQHISGLRRHAGSHA